jgi:hypothetical protein
MVAELPTGGVIYGVRLQSEFVYRYVGLTTRSVEIRLRQHVKVARSGSRFAEDNPFYGRSHNPEQRARWSKSRKGTNVGPENPNYGRFGEDHPSFGHVMSEQARQRLAEERRGPGNPNYGRRASEETRAKMSAVRKGRPMPSSRRSAHTRHHTNRGIRKETCRYCIEDSA